MHVDGATSSYRTTLDPAALGTERAAAAASARRFLAIVSAHVLAAYLAREDSTRPDGFVIEGPRAGGHNAPPRGRLMLDEHGQPVYGPRDDADLAKVARGRACRSGWPGRTARPARVQEALRAGAAGVQVGTVFALSEESGLAGHLRGELLHRLGRDDLAVRTDASVSPTGFPFKVAAAARHAQRRRRQRGTPAPVRPRVPARPVRARRRQRRLPLPGRAGRRLRAQGRRRR